MSDLRVENLEFHYGSKPVLNDVSFVIQEGRFCGLLGPNGAGKSTLFSLLTGLLTIQEGRISIGGVDIQRSVRQALAKIGIVFQQPSLELDMSVEQNMRYFAALHGMGGREVDIRITECLELVKMRERRKEKVRALNGGHKRRMEIARALIHRPEFLLLDEPTIGLDVHSRKAIVEDVHALSAQGMTVFWATHLVDEIWPEDDVVILYRGAVRAHGNAKEIAEGSTLLNKFLEITDELADELTRDSASAIDGATP